jgi:hypothetical protein
MAKSNIAHRTSNIWFFGFADWLAHNHCDPVFRYFSRCPINPQVANRPFTGRRFDQINFEICDMQREPAHPVTNSMEVGDSETRARR